MPFFFTRGRGDVRGKQTVWEEIKEPGSGVSYYFSSVSQSSQWHPPVWMDYVDTKVLQLCCCLTALWVPARFIYVSSILRILIKRVQQNPQNLRCLDY